MNDDRAQEAVDHLQGALRELIAAGQAFLAAFEDVVDRPDTAPNLLAAVESVARRFLPADNADERSPGDEGEPDDDENGGFEPIRVD